MAVSLSVVVAKDGAGTTIAGGLQAQDKSGAGTGPFTIGHVLLAGAAGVNMATVKAASTAAAATDPAFVVALSPNNTALGAGATTSATIRTALASDSPGIIATGTPQASSAAVLSTQGPGTTASRINSAGSTNATSLKGSAGRMFGVSVFNVAAYNVFLKFYDKATAPTVGSDTPVWTVPIQAGGGFAEEFIGSPFPFTLGVAYAITKLQADSDTTAVLAGDLTGSIRWA